MRRRAMRREPALYQGRQARDLVVVRDFDFVDIAILPTKQMRN